MGIALCDLHGSTRVAQGALSAGQFIAFFSAMMLMLQPVRRITNVNATLQRGVAGADSLFADLDEDDEDDTAHLRRNASRGDVSSTMSSFSYGDDGVVIDGVSVADPAGSTLAIVGHSGSGKTTLAALLPRFYELNSGDILLTTSQSRITRSGACAAILRS